MASVRMTDAVSLSGGIRPTKNGYLTANARVARTGVQVYRGFEVGRPDMDKVRVFRPPSEVFKHDAMKSLAHMPVTYTHPPQTVDATNWDLYSVGYTGGDIVRDGDFVRVPLMLCDKDAIAAYKRDGVKELSVGYSCDLDWTPGHTKEGETYDAVQRCIEANHLAVVPVARGGEMLRLGDAAKPELAKPKGGPYEMGPESTYAETGKTAGTNVEEEEDDEQMGPGSNESEGGANDAWPKKGNGDDEEDDDDDDTKDAWRFSDREFSSEKREKLSKTGAAMKGGGFPIQNKEDLANARQALGRAKNRSATIAHIKKRAKALGETLPENWPNDSMDAAPSGTARGVHGMRTIVLDEVPLTLEDQSAAVVLAHIARLEKVIRDRANGNAKKRAAEEDEDEEETRAMDAMHQAIDARDGEIAALKKQLRDALDPRRIDQQVKDKAEVIAKAAGILDKQFVFDGKSAAEIRRATVGRWLGEEAAKNMNDAAIGGAFEAIKSGPATPPVHNYSSRSPMYGSAYGQPVNDGNQALRDAIAEANSRRGAADGSLESAMAARDQAFADLEKRSAEAWRGTSGQGLKT